MDPTIFTQYSPTTGAPNGLPQESKLATYMNRSTSAPVRPINQAMGNLSLESTSQPKKVLVNEFIPMSYYQPSIMAEPPEVVAPAAAMAAHMPMALPTTSQVHQENVGGTTYFYATNSDNLNPSGLNTSASMGERSALKDARQNMATMGPSQHRAPNSFAYPPGPDACLSGNMGPGASPYATQIFTGAPPQMAPLNIKPVAAWGAVPLPNLVPIQLGYAQPPPCHCNDVRCSGVISPRYGLEPQFNQMFSPLSHSEIDANQTPDFTESLAASFYHPETIRQEIYHRNDDIFMQADMRQFPDLPENAEMYSELIPLESAAPHSLATSFRASHRQTGEHFAIRRLHSYPTIPTKRLEMWKSVDHSNVVKLHEFYATQAFGDHSLVLVYTYHPGCLTLMDKFLSGGAPTSSADAAAFVDPFSSDPDAPRPYTHKKNAMLRAVACGALLPEAVLWSLLVQLSAGLRAVHNAGLAIRTLDPTKVIMNGPRVRLAWGGAADAAHANSNDLHQAQQDDLTALGRLALALACRTIHCDNLAASMDLVARTYSADLKNVILYLLSNNNRRFLTDLMPMIGARYYTQIEALQRRADVFEDQLSLEIDNSRLLRILIKLGMVNERPELNLDSSWSETGNRYLLKLFRDKLFHGVSAEGNAWMDLSHLTFALNNLDSGSEEKVELVSRDEESILVVTYAELKHCLDSAYEEVMSLSSGP